MNMRGGMVMRTGRLEDYAQLYKALGDETRLRMLGLLKERELCVCDFMAVLELAQSTASRHLAYLKNSSWVVGRREGKWMYYRLHSGVRQSLTQLRILEQLATLPEMETIGMAMESYLEEKGSEARCV